MTAIGELVAVTLDCPDPAALAEFYRTALDLEILYADDSAAYLGSSQGGVRLGFQKVDRFQKPDWPGQVQPQQLHLDLAVTDLDAAEAALVELGADKAATQPDPTGWRVLLDPAGHPFCVTLSV